MAFTEQSGTLTATGGEDDLVTGQTGDFVLQIVIDAYLMTAGDITVLRLYDEVISTGSVVLIQTWEIAHAQASTFIADLPFIALHNWAVTLEQTDGTLRDYDWSIRQAA